MSIKDSGSRSKFETGAQRDCQEGKGRMDLMPFWALMEVSKIFEKGANKYRANNWRRGIPLSRYADSGLRHFSKWMAGMRDEPHLMQAAWNILCLIETQELIRQGLLPEKLNDLPYNPLDVEDNPNDIPPLVLEPDETGRDEVGDKFDEGGMFKGAEFQLRDEKPSEEYQKLSDELNRRFWLSRLAESADWGKNYPQDMREQAINEMQKHLERDGNGVD